MPRPKPADATVPLNVTLSASIVASLRELADAKYAGNFSAAVRQRLTERCDCGGPGQPAC